MKRIAIDFGSGVTKIYMPGCGVVLMEATCVALEQYEENGEKRHAIKAFGDKARALAGRAAQNTRIVYPVEEGDIAHENLAAALLSYFLEKIEIPPRKARHTEAMFILPCGARQELKAKYGRLAERCGLEMSYYTLTPFAAVLGQNVTLSDSTPVFSVDIGHSLTNIAAFSKDGIVHGINVNLGGNAIDMQLIDDLAENSGFKIGALTAEKLKNTVGSLLHDDNKTAVIDGREISGGTPTSMYINSGRILPVIKAHIDKITEYIKLVITKLPPEVASAVMRGGVYLSGGIAGMDGLSEYLGEQLQIHVNLPEEPLLSSVIGGGTILADDELFEKLSSDLD